MRRAVVAAAVLGLVCAACAPARAQVVAEELRVTGVWPDVELTGLFGVGLDEPLRDDFGARLRVGALWAYEPWIASAGLTGELGGLARRGLGLELGLDHFGGLWTTAALSRVRDAAWLSRLSLGFTFVGVEWQYRGASPDGHALMFLLRLPIGKAWFLLAREG